MAKRRNDCRPHWGRSPGFPSRISTRSSTRLSTVRKPTFVSLVRGCRPERTAILVRYLRASGGCGRREHRRPDLVCQFDRPHRDRPIPEPADPLLRARGLPKQRRRFPTNLGGERPSPNVQTSLCALRRARAGTCKERLARRNLRLVSRRGRDRGKERGHFDREGNDKEGYRVGCGGHWDHCQWILYTS